MTKGAVHADPYTSAVGYRHVHVHGLKVLQHATTFVRHDGTFAPDLSWGVRAEFRVTFTVRVVRDQC